MFKKFGIYQSNICQDAKHTKAMLELNNKIWRLRRKYAKIIVDELALGFTEKAV